MNNQKKLKHKVLEVLEGGLRGNTAARVFSIVLIILIILSITFMLIWDIERFEPLHETFEIIETITIGLFTAELILGLWTADVRFAGHPHPYLRYLTDFMTIVQALAILPFYLGLALKNTPYSEFAGFIEFLKLLHLMKIGEIVVHAIREGKKEKEHGEEETDSSPRSE